ncbi:MAG: alginate lyase family protein [Acidobacteriaceae bacterium]
MMDRRTFCGIAAASITTGVYRLHAMAPDQKVAPDALVDVAAVDRARVLASADRYLQEKPITLTSSTSARSPGGPHDYFSEGDYWWPNPVNLGGPYIQRDGFSNPANFNAHRLALIRLSVQVPALVAAWNLTGRHVYAAHAAGHLRAWFVDPATRMNPNLEHAQAIFGLNKGRGIGIIDTLHLVEVARATSVLELSGALRGKDSSGVRQWFRDYLAWMTSSPNGIAERDAKNNHGTCWLMQVSEFARLTGDGTVTRFARERFRSVIIPRQIAPDGSLPLELARTKPYSYCLFNLDALATTCQILSTSSDSDDLWHFITLDGRSLSKAVAFMVPFIRDKSTWPYARDVEHFDELPVRQPHLLFAGLAYRNPAYIALWKRLDPDPTAPEIIRNFPIRQPLLWV